MFGAFFHSIVMEAEKNQKSDNDATDYTKEDADKKSDTDDNKSDNTEATDYTKSDSDDKKEETPDGTDYTETDTDVGDDEATDYTDESSDSEDNDESPEATDYSDDSLDNDSDDEDSDSSDSDDEDSDSEENNENAGTKDDQLRKFYLLTDFKELQLFIKDTIGKITGKRRNSFEEKEVDMQIVNNFKKLSNVIGDYIVFKFDEDDYTTALYNYRRFFVAIDLNMEMLEKLNQSIENKLKNKEETKGIEEKPRKSKLKDNSKRKSESR